MNAEEDLIYPSSVRKTDEIEVLRTGRVWCRSECREKISVCCGSFDKQ
jgi:hypothetical protein